MEKRLIRENLILNIFRLGLNTLFPFITFPIVSRALGPVYLGKVNFAISVTSYFILFASMGIPNYGIVACSKVREDKEKLKKTICEIVYINSFFVMVTYIVFIGAIIWVKQFEGYKMLLMVNSINIVFTAMGLEWLYTALEDFRYITYRSLLFKFISFILIVLLVKQTEDYIVYNWILVIATTGSNILNFIHAKEYVKFYPLSSIAIKRHFRPILIFFAASVAGTINGNTDLFMLGIYKGDYSVGIYSFSVKIKTLLTSILTAGLGVFYPKFGVLAGKQKYKHYRFLFRKLVIATMSIAVGVSAFFILCCKEIILILGGKDYLTAISPMNILTACIIPLGVTWLLGVGVLQVIGRERQYARVISYVCLINVGINVFLIPYFDVVGASIATLCSEIFCGIMFYIYSKDFLQGCLRGTKVYLIFITGGISFMVCSILKWKIEIEPPILSLIVYGILFFTLFSSLLLLIHRELRRIFKSMLLLSDFEEREL